MNVPTHDDFTWTAPTKLAELAACDTTWGHYLATKVHFSATDRAGTVWPAETATATTPPLSPLHVINAVQPADRPNADNQARMELLDRELQAAGLTFIHAVGSSLDGDYHEDSRAVFGLTDEQACALGRRFGQVAVFALSGPRWSLLACATDRQTHRACTWVPDTP